ncbi:MAG: class I SAM-dependent methyltransferase [Spirochaetota bacterium]
MPGSDQCGLCGAELPACPTEIVQGRAYHHCSVCDLLQMAQVDRLCTKAEEARYLKHDNSTRTKGYTAFLERLMEPVIHKLDQRGEGQGKSRGLDFGSGPYPMLAELMAERGYPLEIYDPLFAPRDRAWFLDHPFDFILCCETAEHFYRPFDEFSFMVKLLAPQGFIAIMTSLRRADSKITTWHYARDETHVALYSKKTMGWIAGHFGFCISFPAQDVVFLDTPRATSVVHIGHWPCFPPSPDAGMRV